MTKKVRLVRTRVPYFVPNLTAVQAAIKEKQAVKKNKKTAKKTK